MKPVSILVALVLAGLGAFALASSSLAGHGQDSASGHVRNVFSQELDFSAKATQTGINASGRARLTLTNSDPNQVFSGEVTCLRVTGPTATAPAMASIGVRVTNPPAGSSVQSMIIFTSDGGKFSGAVDTASVTTSTLPPPPDGGCPTPAAGVTVIEGDVTIHNTFP